MAIVDWDPPATAPSTTANGQWTASRGNNAFNDVMTYFHIDQNQRYLQALQTAGEVELAGDQLSIWSNNRQQRHAAMIGGR